MDTAGSGVVWKMETPLIAVRSVGGGELPGSDWLFQLTNQPPPHQRGGFLSSRNSGLSSTLLIHASDVFQHQSSTKSLQTHLCLRWIYGHPHYPQIGSGNEAAEGGSANAMENRAPAWFRGLPSRLATANGRRAIESG